MSDDKKESWYTRNHDKALAHAKEYRNTHREKYRQYWKTYYEKNKEILKNKHREYVRKNRDVINSKGRTKYYKNHQAKKKQEAPKIVSETPLSPTVELPPWTMIVSRGNHLVTWD